VGLQLLGNIFAEDVILRVADAFEQVTDYHKQWPEALAYA
jgi:Asp-tRNA(Asn)/Glu-tRNA(Gln) amidotransferase A subunit family amidase